MSEPHYRGDLERYLSGTMTPEEERDFYIHVALNPQLQKRLRLHRAVDGSLRAEKERAHETYRRLAAIRPHIVTTTLLSSHATTGIIPKGITPGSASTGMGWGISAGLKVIAGFFLAGGAAATIFLARYDSPSTTESTPPAAATRTIPQRESVVNSGVVHEPPPQPVFPDGRGSDKERTTMPGIQRSRRSAISAGSDADKGSPPEPSLNGDSTLQKESPSDYRNPWGEPIRQTHYIDTIPIRVYFKKQEDSMNPERQTP